MQVFHRLPVADVRTETDDTVSLAFAVPEPLRPAYAFLPGQHLTVRLVLDGEELRRSYSICSGIDDPELRVAVKHLAGGRVSRWIRETVRRGDLLEVMPPSGRFTVVPDPARVRHLLAVAAGSGITPIMSIMRSLLSREPGSQVTLIYGNQRTATIIFRDAIDELKNRYLDRLQVIHVLSRESAEVPLLSGRITDQKIRAICGRLVDLDDVDDVLLCGPEPMTLQLRDTFLDLGIPPGHLHLELYGTATASTVAPAPPDGRSHRLTVITGGVKSELAAGPTTSVLDTALQAGLDLPFACKSGVCATCRAKVCEGRVEMAVNYALEPDELAAGFVLTCQSRPVSERVVVDYDAG